jgi:threonyl-tRNA synthetase
VVGIPVADEFGSYLEEIAQLLRDRGVRVSVDHSDDRMQKKIRNHTTAKVPFMLIAGGEDRDNRAVSFRFRDGSQENGIAVDEAVERIVAAIEAKVQV